MSLINNFSMQGKLLALVIPALLVVVYFAAHRINDNYGDLANMRELQAMVRLVDTGAPLAEALQQERDRSLVFFASVYAPEEAEKALANKTGEFEYSRAAAELAEAAAQLRTIQKLRKNVR